MIEKSTIWGIVDEGQSCGTGLISMFSQSLSVRNPAILSSSIYSGSSAALYLESNHRHFNYDIPASLNDLARRIMIEMKTLIAAGRIRVK